MIWAHDRTIIIIIILHKKIIIIVLAIRSSQASIGSDPKRIIDLRLWHMRTACTKDQAWRHEAH